ncbi:MAG: MoaD/ThiS family protein [Nitrososphaeria archaeon]|nr:MoaD/ThiS family protein [Nitrososphaeria archaeon]
MKIELVGPLRRIMDVSEIELEVNERTMLVEVLNRLPEKVKKHVLKSVDTMSPQIMILVNGVEVKSIGIEKVYVEDKDKVVLIPIIHGG